MSTNNASKAAPSLTERFGLRSISNLFSSAPSSSSSAPSFFSTLRSGTASTGFFNSFSAPSLPAFASATGSSWFSSASTPSNAGLSTSYLGRMASYLGGILIVLLVLLLFIHFFITPIFQLHPGGPGILPVPGTDDGVLFWNTTTPQTIPNAQLPISNQVDGYTLMTDIMIENPFEFTSKYRLLFRRSDEETPTSTGDTMVGFLGRYNLAAALLPQTNDMVVSLLTSDHQSQDIIVSNVPIQESFRLIVVVMEHAMEVYLNGKLVKTKTFSHPAQPILGNIYPTIGTDRPIATLQNLKIWPRILTTSEIRYAKPSPPRTKGTGSIAMPSMSGCVSDSLSSAADSVSSMVSASKDAATNALSYSSGKASN